MARTDTSFTVFSEVIEADEPEEHDWLVKAAKRLWGVPGGDPVEDWPGAVMELMSSVEFDDIYGMMPKWKPLKRKRGIIVYADDGCSMFAVTPLVQLYLRKYHCDWYWWTEWAEICETPSPSSFRGGAVFVTEQHVAWHFTTHWVNSMIERVNLQHGG